MILTLARLRRLLPLSTSRFFVVTKSLSAAERGKPAYCPSTLCMTGAVVATMTIWDRSPGGSAGWNTSPRKKELGLREEKALGGPYWG